MGSIYNGARVLRLPGLIVGGYYATWVETAALDATRSNAPVRDGSFPPRRQ